MALIASGASELVHVSCSVKMSRLKSFTMSCICDALLTVDHIFMLQKFMNDLDSLVLLALMFVGGPGFNSTFPLDSSKIATITIFDETMLRGRNDIILGGHDHNSCMFISMSERYRFEDNLKRCRDSCSVWFI